MDGSEAASARARTVVLVVDDDPGTVRVLANGIGGTLRRFEVLTAYDGREAVDILDSRAVDAIVTDLNMPIMDGFELIAHVTNRSAAVPIVVLSGLSSSEIDERLRPYGGLRVLGKPEGFRNIGDVLDELLGQLGPGRLEGIALSSVVQLIESERRSCTLIVTSRRRKGRLYFESGRLINAFSDDFGADGEAAAYDILGWSDTAIAFEALPDEVRREIHTPLQLMLIEVATVQDQLRERTERSIPPAPAAAPSPDRPEPHASADREEQTGQAADHTDPGAHHNGFDGHALDDPAVADAAAENAAAEYGAAHDDATDDAAADDEAGERTAADEPPDDEADDAAAFETVAVAGDAVDEDSAVPPAVVEATLQAAPEEAAVSAVEDAEQHEDAERQAADAMTSDSASTAEDARPAQNPMEGDAVPAREAESPEASVPPPAVGDTAAAPVATPETTAVANDVACDRSGPTADLFGGTSADGLEGTPPLGGGTAASATTSPASNAHVTRLVAAVERLTQRTRDADAVLAALSDEIESFRLAQQHFDEENARRERRCQELEAFRHDVARLARQILGRVDELFLSRPGADAAALDVAAATVEAIATAAASASTDGDPSSRSP